MRCYVVTMALFSFSALANEGLCLEHERAIFSCKIDKSSKYLSVCASKRLDAKDSYVQYRFGAPGKIELQFPAAKEDSIKQFSYAHYVRYQVDRFELSFNVGRYRYSVFHDYEGDIGTPQTFDGVTVSTAAAPERTAEILCATPVINQLHQLENVVPCDHENALSSC